MEKWHLVKSQKKSGDYVSHVVKVLLFHPSVRLFHVSLFELFPIVLLQLQDCDIKSEDCKEYRVKQGFLSSFKSYMTADGFKKLH